MRYVLLSILAAGLLATPAQALQFVTTNTYAVAAGETIDDELWLQTLDAEINGTVKDDLFLFGGDQILLGGEFERNLWSIGNTLTLTGTAQRNVRLAGKTILLNSPVGGNLILVADTIKVSPDTTIGGDTQLFGNNIILEGTMKGDVSITAVRRVTLSGTIDGNLNIVAPEIILQRDTRIGGNLTYTAPKELVPAEGVVAGKLTRAIPRSAPAFSMKQLRSRALWFFAALLVGVPFMILFPITTAMATQAVRTAPWRCLWVGALCMLVLPILGIMSAFSGIGLPLGALILGSWGFMAYLSRIIMGLAIGTLILRKNNGSFGHALLSMAGGLALIYAASAIPTIAFSVWITVISMGTGAFLISLFQKRRLMIQIPEELQHLEKLKNQHPNTNQEEK